MEPARMRLATESASLPASRECPGHVAQKVTGAFQGRGRHIAWQEFALPMNRADGPRVRPRSSRQRGRTMPVQVLARSLPGLRARAAAVAQRLLATRWRVQPHRPDSTGNTLIYRAAAALPHANREWATHALACQLRIMAAAAGGTLDWATLAMTGPTKVAGAPELARFEWTASVAVRGVSDVDALPDPDAFPPARAAADATLPFRVDSSSVPTRS
jgi:hypothetical protein